MSNSCRRLREVHRGRNLLNWDVEHDFNWMKPEYQGEKEAEFKGIPYITEFKKIKGNSVYVSALQNTA